MATFKNQIVIEATSNLGKVSKNIDKAFRKISTGASKATKQMKRLGDATKKVGESIKKAGQKSFLPVTGGIAALGLASLKQAANIESLEVAFESLTGSTEKGKEALKGLLEFSERTPFDPEEVANAGKALIGFGVEVDDIQDKLKFLGDISAGSGKDLRELSAIYGKALAKGVADTETLNQFAEAGINISDALIEIQKNKTGVELTKIELRKSAEQGKISSELIEKALIRMATGTGQFANQMEKQSQTIGGLFSTLKGRVTLILADFGKEIKEAFNLGEVIPRVGDFIQMLADKFRALSPEGKKQAVIFAAIAAAVPPLLIVLGSLAAAVGVAISGFATLFSLLFLNPIGLIIVAITALVASFFFFRDEWQTVGDFIAEQWAKLKQMFVNGVNFLSELLGIDLMPIIKTVWEPIGTFFSFFWDNITGLFDKGMGKVNGLIGSVTGKFEKVKDFFSFGGDEDQDPEQAATNALANITPQVPQAPTVSNRVTQDSKVDINIKSNAPVTSVKTNSDDNTDISTTLGLTSPMAAN